MNHTEGKARIHRHSQTSIETEDGRLIATTGGYSNNAESERVFIENNANAERIKVLWNAADGLSNEEAAMALRKDNLAKLLNI